MRRAICAASAAVLVVTGCGSAETPAVVMKSTRAASMVLPIASYLPTVDEYAVIQRAHGIIERQCMAERGFDWVPPEPYTGDVFGREVDRRYRYVLDSDIAAEFGYHVVGAGAPDEADSALDDAGMAALSGEDESAEEPGGCMAEAIERLAGGMTHIEAGGLNLPYPVHEVNFDAFSRSQQDPRVRAALGNWSTCMAERGYDVSDPVNYLPEDFDIGTPEPSAAEVDMALVDVECQTSTDLVRVWFEVDSELQRTMLGERADVFAQITREYQELLRRATGVVEGAQK
jgi:hypothetical protein